MSSLRLDDPLVTALRDEATRRDLSPGALFEDMVREIGLAVVGPGDRVIDVGAHGGLHALPLARQVGWRGHVYAFEPLPHLARKLRRKKILRFLPQLHVCEFAVADTPGTAVFEHFESFPEYSGLKRRITPFSDDEGQRRTIEVSRVRLDDHPATKGPVRFIKMDIEGGEYHALLGASETLQDKRPILVFENGRDHSATTYGYTSEDFFLFFETHGYRLFTLGGVPFTARDWHAEHEGWEFVGLPDERVSMAEELPGIGARVLSASCAVIS